MFPEDWPDQENGSPKYMNYVCRFIIGRTANLVLMRASIVDFQPTDPILSSKVLKTPNLVGCFLMKIFPLLKQYIYYHVFPDSIGNIS